MAELCWAVHTPSGDQPPHGRRVGRQESLTGTARGRLVESWTTWDTEGVLRLLEGAGDRDEAVVRIRLPNGPTTSAVTVERMGSVSMRSMIDLGHGLGLKVMGGGTRE
jgi:hypothetical protein